MASNQTIQNIANILGMLKEFNEPYKEAEKRMQEMAFEKDMVELKYQNQLELIDEQLDASKNLELYKMTDPKIVEERKRMEDVRLNEIKEGRASAKEIANIRVEGEKEIAKITTSFKQDVSDAIEQKDLDASGKSALIGFLDKDAQGVLTVEDINEASGLLGRELFFDNTTDQVIELGKDSAAALGFAGAGKLMRVGGTALSKVPNPWVAAAGYGLIGLGYLSQYGGAGIETAQVLAGAGSMAAEGLEKATGVDLNFQKASILDSTLKNRNNSLLQLADSAIEGQNAILGNTREGGTLKKGLQIKVDSAQDPDLYNYINKYGSEEQKKELKRQDNLISTVINPVIK
jgi:hypothetical protein